MVITSNRYGLSTRTKHSMPLKKIRPHLFLIVLVVVCIFASSVYGILSDKTTFVIVSITLLLYLFLEIRKIAIVQPRSWLINPIVLASFLAFGVDYGLTNFVYLLDIFQYRLLMYGLEDYYWMSLSMFAVFLAAFAMWRGYYAAIGQVIIGCLRRSSFLKKVTRKSFEVRLPFILLALVISFIGSVLSIKLGVFGYSADIRSLYTLSSYTQYLKWMQDLSYLALVALSLSYFSRKDRRPIIKVLLLATLTYTTICGFLSGFKSAAVMPVIAVGVCYYLANGKVPRRLILVAVFLVFASYALIEPFRIARHSDPWFEERNPYSIFEEFVDASLGKGVSAVNRYSFDLQGIRDTIFAIFIRKNITLYTAQSIQFAHQSNGLGHNAPQFLRNLLISPAYALIPRLIWRSKPFGDLGAWFNSVVLGHNFRNAVGMGSVAYLYFAGGIITVFIGFFCLGVIQRVWNDFFLQVGSGGLIVFLGLLPTLSRIPSSFDSIPVLVIRNTLLLLFAQYCLFRK